MAMMTRCWAKSLRRRRYGCLARGMRRETGAEDIMIAIAAAATMVVTRSYAICLLLLSIIVCIIVGEYVTRRYGIESAPLTARATGQNRYRCCAATWRHYVTQRFQYIATAVMKKYATRRQHWKVWYVTIRLSWCCHVIMVGYG